MDGGPEHPELSELLEGQRRMEGQLADLKELLHSMRAREIVHPSILNSKPQPLAQPLRQLSKEDRPSTAHGQHAGDLGDGRQLGTSEDEPVVSRSERRCSTGQMMKSVESTYLRPHLGRQGSSVEKSQPFALRAGMLARMIVNDHKFDYVMGALIIGNTITLGVEIQSSLDNHPWLFLSVLEYIFLMCFIIEIVIKLLANGLRNFRGAWFVFDVVLAVTGMSGAVLATFSSSLEGDSSWIVFLDDLQLLRILRLLRLLKALRSIEQFNQLWKITVGLIKCFKTVMYSMVLVFATIYFFSCLGVELIFKSELLQSNPITSPLVNEYFNSLPKTMLTLVAFANADSIAAIYVPLCSVQPSLSLYFGALWLILTISLLNLVAAVIVEDAITSASEDQILQQRSVRKQLTTLVPMIRNVFRELDMDGKGTLDIHDLSFNNIQLPRELRSIIQSDKLIDLFEQMDVDDNGEIDEKEFVDAVCHLALSGVPTETAQIIQLLKRQEKHLAALAFQHSPAEKLSDWEIPAVLSERFAVMESDQRATCKA